MALVQTQTAAKTVGSTSSTIVWAGNTTSGNLIVVGIATDQGATGIVTSVTDSQSNVYSKVGTIVEGGAAISTLDIFYARAILGGTTPTITANFNAAAITGLIAREYSGYDTTSPLNVTIFTKSTASNGAPTTAASAPTNNYSELVIAFACTGDSGNTYTAGAGYGNAVTINTGVTIDCGMEDKATTVPGAQTASFSITNISDWACALVTFRTPISQPGNIGKSIRAGDGLSTAGTAN